MNHVNHSEREQYLTSLLIALCLASEKGYLAAPAQLCINATDHVLHIQVSGLTAMVWATPSDEAGQ